MSALSGLDLSFALSALDSDLRDDEALLARIRECGASGANLISGCEQRIAEKQARMQRFLKAFMAACAVESGLPT